MSTAPEWVTSLVDQYAEASQQASNVQARSAEQLAVYESRLDRTLARLQERVREQEAVLTKLRNASRATPLLAPSEEPQARLRQLQTIKAAYDAITPLEPQLPSPDSPLPTAIAQRHTLRTIAETKTAITQVGAKLSTAQQRLEVEQANLRDARLIAQSLEKRIVSLREEQLQKGRRSPEESAKELIRGLQRRKAGYESDIKRLVKAFNAFIDQHLAVMLAAEELGGPVVGDVMTVDEDTLMGGFSHQGKARRVKPPADDGMRQRRIDQIWGQEIEDEGESERSEKDAAGAEIRALTEELLNASAAATSGPGGGSSAYVELLRDSAAARLLVRARVAQFHPRDARRLRLLDFGREIDD